MLLKQAPQQQLYSLADGARGTRQTMRLMAQVVRDAVRSDLDIRRKAADLVAFIPGNSWREQARLLFEFVRDRVRYLGDVNGIETIQTPGVTLSLGYGDCDDKSTLLAALLESIGHPARFRAVGFAGFGEFEHVYVETKIGNDWLAMDATMPHEMGWAPVDEQRPVASMRESI